MAVGEAVEKAAENGVSRIVWRVIRTTIAASMVEELIRNTIQIVDAFEENDRIKKVLDLLLTAITDTKNNLNTWNTQIPKAVRKGKLRKYENLPEGTKPYEAMVFSEEMNAEVEVFLESFQPFIIEVGGVAKKKDLGKIEGAVKDAKNAFVKAAETFLSTVQTWDNKDPEIKSEARIVFKVGQLESNISAIKSQDV
eukprot:scpid105076/ scgid7805/ 